jgi:hypothetical protein
MKEYIAPLLRFGALILLLTTIYEQNKVINEYKSKAIINTDSLVMEIQMRDILISKCKDTSYGEQVIK